MLFKIIAPLFLLAAPFSESELLRRGQAHLIIGDPDSAIQEVEKGLIAFPDSLSLASMKMKAYSAKGDETKLLSFYKEFKSKYPEAATSAEILEDICWSIVKKGSRTSTQNIRLLSLIAAAITQDAKALPLLHEALCDSCAPIRGVGVMLASQFGDEDLKEEILSLFQKEKNPEVRVELAGAFSHLHLKEKVPLLVERLLKKDCNAEEKIKLLVSISSLEEGIDKDTLKKLSLSEFSVLRLLAAEAISALLIEDCEEILFSLLSDRNSEVRTATIKALGLLKIKHYKGESTVPLLVEASECGDNVVAIMAGWSLLILHREEGERVLEKYIKDERAHIRSLAAAAITAAGPFGISLAQKWISLSADPFVRVNLGIGLIRQRVDLSKATSAIQDLFLHSCEKWMWKEEGNGLFKSLQKSDLKHNGLIQNYPEAASQAAHLELINLLAICEDQNALNILKNYIRQRDWQITGIAAELLLGEGDENAIILIRELLGDADKKVRLDAALTLAMWGKDSAALPALIDLYQDADKMTKIRILEALGRVGDKKTLPFLAAQLSHSSQTLRVVAAACVLMTLNH